MSPLTIKTLLVGYLVLSAACVYLLWSNVAASDASKNTLTLYSSLLITIIAVLPYLTPQKWTKYFTVAFLYDRHTESFLLGRQESPYFYRMGQLLANLSGSDFKMAKRDDRYGAAQDLLERGIFQTLSFYFQQNWKFTNQKMIATPQGTGELFQMDMKAGKTTVTTGQVVDLLASNRYRHTLIRGEQNALQSSFVLPPDTALSIDRDPSNPIEKIKFNNPRLSTTLTLSFSSAGVLQQGIPNVLDPDPSDMNRFESVVFLVELEAMTPFARSFFQESEDYKRWFEQVAQRLEFFSWSSIQSSSLQH